jgi:hypothetical protein
MIKMFIREDLEVAVPHVKIMAWNVLGGAEK